MKQKTIILIATILLLSGFAGWFLLGNNTQNQVTFEETKVITGTISNSITATGTVEPVTQVEVGTQVSGIVNKLYVDYNSEVKKGQVIAELDKTNLLNELASKQSALASAQTEYEYQLKNYTRSKALHEKVLVSDTDYELVLYSYEKAKNSYNIAKNDLAKAQTNLGYATIYSPIDGVVLSRSVEEGQTVASSFSTPTLFIIANDLTDMQVIADVDEADIGDIKEGLHVQFAVDAYLNDTFDGYVTQVRQEATTTSNVVTYEVVISAPNPSLKLKPGLTANITIYTLEKNNVLCVPAKALLLSPKQSLVGPDKKISDCDTPHKLWTSNDFTLLAHPVEIGISNGILTEIVSGIAEGTTILTNISTSQTITPQPQGETEKSPFMPSRPGEKK